jgi:hypothetical protein
MSERLLKALVVAGSLSAGAPCGAREATAQETASDTKAERERSIEDLNLIGAAVTMPAFSDTVLGVESDIRRAPFSKGMALRVNVVPRYSQNLLDGPVPAGQQAYIGQRPTFISGVNPIFTADLRQLGLRQAQLNIGLGWRYSNWSPAGPNTLAMTSLHLFKGWGDRRVELKAGYIGNDLEFVGLQVGGSTATGAQGVYAVLPNEVGLSYFPLTAPSLNLRVRGPSYSYFKTAAQRSLDAAGGQSTVDRNPSGFRFLVDGNGLLVVGEAGYQRPASALAPQAWLRVGYMRNSTRYTNRSTGQEESGNYCAYVLLDYQLRMADPRTPARGLFVGGTAMTEGAFPVASYRCRHARRGLQGPQPVLHRRPGRAGQDRLSQLDVPHRHLYAPCRARELPEPEPGLRARAGALSPRRGRAHVHGELEPVPVVDVW